MKKGYPKNIIKYVCVINLEVIDDAWVFLNMYIYTGIYEGICIIFLCLYIYMYSICGCVLRTYCVCVTLFKVKVKLSLCLTKHHTMNTYWWSGGVGLCILNLGTRWR